MKFYICTSDIVIGRYFQTIMHSELLSNPIYRVHFILSSEPDDSTKYYEIKDLDEVIIHEGKLFCPRFVVLKHVPYSEWLQDNLHSKFVYKNISATFKNGKPHSYDDKPAQTTFDNIHLWYDNGEIHRDSNDDNKPAILANIPTLEGQKQIKIWMQHDKIYRKGQKPAITGLEWLDQCSNNAVKGLLKPYIDSICINNPNSRIDLRTITKLWIQNDIIFCDNKQCTAKTVDGISLWITGYHVLHRENKPAIHGHNIEEYWENGQIVSRGNSPSIIAPNVQIWYNDSNEIHRDGDLPAMLYTDGTKVYYQHGQIHRLGDLPAIETSANKEYWSRNLINRQDNKPSIIMMNGTEHFYRHSQFLKTQEF